MIALVSPAAAAIARNAPLSTGRSGRPNDTFEAPSDMFTPSSSRINEIVSSVTSTASLAAPTVIASGSMTTSSGGIPWSPAAETILRAMSRRCCGVSGMPVSSLARPMTAAPYLATSGRISSSRSSSPVTEFTSALPSYTESPASSASITDESMHSGASTVSCTSRISAFRSSASSTSGMPAFTSSMSAPASTCASASLAAVSYSPFRSCSAKTLRPVGLIRSPITQNGCPGPMMTVLDRDRRTVSTRFPLVAGGDGEPLAEPLDAGLAAEADQVQARDAGQVTGVVGQLAGHLEALGLRVAGALAALDDLARHRDAGDVLVDEAQGARRARQADRRQQRHLGGQPRGHARAQERVQALGLEAHLQLQEA